jgi:hypothetical protein
MFRAPRAAAWTCALLAAAAAGTGAGLAVAPIEPSLRVHVSPSAENELWEFVDLRIEARGGEPIPMVRIEVLRGDVQFGGPTTYRDLAPEHAARVVARVPSQAPEDPVLRVHQHGRVRRTYDVPIPVTR